MSKHWSWHTTEQVVIRHEGTEGINLSFHYFIADALIGKTIGEIVIGFASWRFAQKRSLINDEPK